MVISAILTVIEASTPVSTYASSSTDHAHQLPLAPMVGALLAIASALSRRRCTTWYSDALMSASAGSADFCTSM